MRQTLFTLVIHAGLLSLAAAQEPPARFPDLEPPPPIPSRIHSPAPSTPAPAPVAPPSSGIVMQALPATSVESAPMRSAALPSTQSPQVSVELIAPETANIGQPAVHEIVVRNVGQCPVAQVHVEQEVPPGTKYLGGEPRVEGAGDRLIWNLGTLEPGTEKRIKANLQSNSEGELRTRATVSYATTCSTVTKFTRPKLEISMTGPESVLIGETAVFQIRLANTGSGPIQKLLLRDRLPAGLQHPQGPVLEAEVAGLAPGETRTVMLKTTAAKVGNYVHEIQAVADGVAIEGVQLAGATRNPDLEAAAKTPIHVLEPGLQVKLTGPRTCLVRCESILTIDLTNPGSATTKNIRLSTPIPEGMEFVAVSDDGSYDSVTKSATWAMAALEPAAHRVLTLKVRGTALGEAAGVVTAQAEGGLTAKSELPIKIEGIPALSLEVTDPDDPSLVDKDFIYEIRVVNQGTCPCTGIQIVAAMPEGMELREASAPTPYKLNGQQIQFAPYAKLATKADLVYRLKVRSKLPGDVRFRVQLTCDQLQQPVFKEESSRFYKP